MNAKQARELAEKKNDKKSLARVLGPILKCCYDEIKRAAKIGHYSVRSPLPDLSDVYPLMAISAAESQLRKDGFTLGGITISSFCKTISWHR